MKNIDLENLDDESLLELLASLEGLKDELDITGSEING